MKKRILVIDDEPDFTTLLKLNLEAEGYYNVREENDASLALQSARDFAPDLVVLDVMMPHLDGSDVAQWLRKDKNLQSVPVLFMTALVSTEDAPQGAHDSGGNTFLPKTTSIAKLIECIEQKIKRS